MICYCFQLSVLAIKHGDAAYIESGFISFMLAAMNIFLVKSTQLTFISKNVLKIIEIAGCGYAIFEIHHVYMEGDEKLRKVFDELKLRKKLGICNHFKNFLLENIVLFLVLFMCDCIFLHIQKVGQTGN